MSQYKKDKEEKEEKNEAGNVAFIKKLSIGIILTLFGYGLVGIWWASDINTKVGQNSDSVAILEDQLKESTTIFLTREQVDDILGSRDEKLTNIEQTLIRLEKKIDNLR